MDLIKKGLMFIFGVLFLYCVGTLVLETTVPDSDTTYISEDRVESKDPNWMWRCQLGWRCD